MKTIAHFIAIAGILLLSNCSTHRMTRSSELKPTKIDSNTSYIVPLDASIRQNIFWTDGNGRIRMLSEVSPDAIVTATLDLTSKLTAKLKSGDELSAEQLTKITQSVAQLGKRTVAVTILRDALYRLEEYNMNTNSSRMDSMTFSLFNKILGSAETIARAEIESEQTEQARALAEAEREISKQKELILEKEEIHEQHALIPTDNQNSQEAASWEKKGFELLLGKDIDGAIEAFQNAENIYPTFHNVYEMGKILKMHKDLLKSTDTSKANSQKEIYKKILDRYSWGMPEDIKNKFKAKAN